MMDVSEEAELLMLRLVEGRRFVCRLELTEEGRKWMGWLGVSLGFYCLVFWPC